MISSSGHDYNKEKNFHSRLHEGYSLYIERTWPYGDLGASYLAKLDPEWLSRASYTLASWSDLSTSLLGIDTLYWHAAFRNSEHKELLDDSLARENHRTLPPRIDYKRK
jgi:hypothetical protein